MWLKIHIGTGSVLGDLHHLQGYKSRTVMNEAAVFNIQKKIAAEFSRHSELAGSKFLDYLNNRLYSTISNGSASRFEWETAIETLSKMLFQHYKRHVVILIDEYDVPIQSGFEHGYYDKIIAFMRNFLHGAFKDNPSLYRGVWMCAR